MADEIEKTAEGTKEVLAPADEPRENLILTAVKFLHNPKVTQSPLYQKKAFLERKGLTKEEVDIALQRAGVVDDASATQQVPPPGPFPQLNGPPPVHQHHPPGPITFWSRTKDFTTTAVILASVSYAVYRLYQLYVRPWLVGRSDDDEAHRRRLEQYFSEQAKTSTHLQHILQSIQESLATQHAAIENLHQHVINKKNMEKFEQSTESHLIAEIKSEVTSLKGLLLSRRQFPPTPHTGPVIPTWQLDSSSSLSVSGSASHTYEMVKASSCTEALEEPPSSASLDAPTVSSNLSDNSQDVRLEQTNSNVTIRETIQDGMSVERVAQTENSSELSKTSLEQEDMPKPKNTDSDTENLKVNGVLESNTEGFS